MKTMVVYPSGKPPEPAPGRPIRGWFRPDGKRRAMLLPASSASSCKTPAGSEFARDLEARPANMR